MTTVHLSDVLQVNRFVAVCDNAYTKKELLASEKVMLKKLKFDLTVPTPYNFLGRYLKAAGLSQDEQASAYASYLVELALPDYGMLKHSYSTLAAAAVLLTNRCAQIVFSELLGFRIYP